MSAILAIDGGGTHTRIGLYTAEGKLIVEGETDPSNLVAADPDDAAEAISAVGRKLAAENGVEIDTVVAGVSGFGAVCDDNWFPDALFQNLKPARVLSTTDIHALFYSNCTSDNPILVIAGTGSSVIIRQPNGQPVVAGGLGPILGDEGSAYCIALEAIRSAQKDSNLLNALRDATGEPDFKSLIPWLEISSKTEVAQLARVVVELAEQGNKAARASLAKEASRLAALTVRASEKAGLDDSSNSEKRVVLVHGGMFENSLLYKSLFEQSLQGVWRTAVCIEPSRSGHAAVVELARAETLPHYVRVTTESESIEIESGKHLDVAVPLDAMSPFQIARDMTTQDGFLYNSISEVEERTGLAIETAASCIVTGGRIIYMGAGTSGRLGVLDASECPPTFGVSEDSVIGIIAGGDRALRNSIEGAEDDTDLAVSDLRSINPPINSNDIVIGITASGTTPYVLAALKAARALRANTAIVSCNPVSKNIADIIIAIETLPELLPGSTRLTAGTATKIVLNQISTGAMAKAGYVFEGLMVGVRPVNKKLRARCIRIISKLTEKDLEASEKLLDETDGSIPVAVLMVREELSLEDARARLDSAGGILRKALEMV